MATTSVVTVKWWAPWLHFGIAATGVISAVATVAGFVPGPVALVGTVLAAVASPVAKVLGHVETKVDNGQI